jgi:hypothetical protein
MKIIFILTFFFLSSVLAAALDLPKSEAGGTASLKLTSTEIEASCRVKAKEIAAETYRACVTDQKNTQIEEIKKEYQNKLQALKAHYEAELSKLAPAQSKAAVSETVVHRESKAKTSGKANKAKSSQASKKLQLPETGSEMSLQLKKAPTTNSAVDASVMDLPEPIPVEEL